MSLKILAGFWQDFGWVCACFLLAGKLPENLPLKTLRKLPLDLRTKALKGPLGEGGAQGKPSRPHHKEGLNRKDNTCNMFEMAISY